jgi:hypothetical protein
VSWVQVYLSLNHLVALCGRFIVAHVTALDVPAAAESAARLHVYSSEHGLDTLGKFCASFLAVHIRAARAAPAWRALGGKELDEARLCNPSCVLVACCAAPCCARLHVYAPVHGLDALGKCCASFLATHMRGARRAHVAGARRQEARRGTLCELVSCLQK